MTDLLVGALVAAPALTVIFTIDAWVQARRVPPPPDGAVAAVRPAPTHQGGRPGEET